MATISVKTDVNFEGGDVRYLIAIGPTPLKGCDYSISAPEDFRPPEGRLIAHQIALYLLDQHIADKQAEASACHGRMANP